MWPSWGAIQSDVDLRRVYWVEADITVVVESAGQCALLRVPRPLCGLLLYLRKAHHPTDLASVLVRWQGASQKLPALAMARMEVNF
ncbi:hypothetical protein BLL52_4057 [Rhodoferax antarcticus ANT.BR]|uniref:Uncharacterized protein n=1 Tax=Rhodoferax antarcticus ANT.BR TaxID=1111071 RepID=A0A1Q8Y9K6_9BURK|nr:hypothetical protein BLL52_4057 [Rhodoferax antarcticus ANT.BR]